MNIIVHPSKLNGMIDAIPSKSYAHRFLICAALADNTSVLKIDSSSDDIDATIRCLRGLGAKIEVNGEFYTVTPINRSSISVLPDIDCGESGSTLRFIVPIASALKGAKIKTHGRLPSRPMSDLIDCLSFNGVSVNKSDDVYTISGNLNSNTFSIAGNVSSQYITGILLMLPLIGGGKVHLTSKLESASYVDITIDVMKRFGVDVVFENNTYEVSNDVYHAQNDIIPGDWSNGTFWLTSRIYVGNLDVNSYQGDKQVLQVIENMGCTIDSCDEKICVRGNVDRDISIDVGNIPDSVPALCVFAAKSSYRTTFTNASRLKDKESNRIQACLDMLTNLGVNAYETIDGFCVEGNGSKMFKSCTINCYGDHRIAMSAATACDNISGDIKLIGAECVNKSYPGFWSDFESLGGNIDVEYDR